MILKAMMAVAVLAVAIKDCGSETTVAEAEAICAVVDIPPHVIKTKRVTGQFWINKTVEGFSRICGWPPLADLDAIETQIGSHIPRGTTIRYHLERQGASWREVHGTK